MKKSEMNAKQLETYSLVRKKLSGYDFDLDDGKWFDKDINAETEIEGSFDNGDMELILEYSVKDALFTLTLVDNESGRDIIFDLFPEDKMDDVLKCINSFKEDISGENFQDHINTLVKVCPKVFTYKDDKPFRLEPNED